MPVFLYLQRFESPDMTTTLIATVLLLLAAVVAMAFKVLLVKGGRFPSHHVHDNAALRRRGVRCGREQAMENDNKQNRHIK